MAYVKDPRTGKAIMPSSPLSIRPLLAAAERHGLDSEPDHEVSDLQAVLKACWLRMSRTQRQAILEEFQYLMIEWLGE